MSVILLVEDCVDTLNIMNVLLLSKGYTVLRAASVQEALAVVYTYKGVIDVLVTDLKLGDGLGSDLAHLMGKKVPKSSILVTGTLQYPAKQHQGFDDYMVKPIDLDLLCRMVDNCVELHNHKKKVA